MGLKPQCYLEGQETVPGDYALWAYRHHQVSKRRRLRRPYRNNPINGVHHAEGYVVHYGDERPGGPRVRLRTNVMRFFDDIRLCRPLPPDGCFEEDVIFRGYI